MTGHRVMKAMFFNWVWLLCNKTARLCFMQLGNFQVHRYQAEGNKASFIRVSKKSHNPEKIRLAIISVLSQCVWIRKFKNINIPVNERTRFYEFVFRRVIPPCFRKHYDSESFRRNIPQPTPILLPLQKNDSTTVTHRLTHQLAVSLNKLFTTTLHISFKRSNCLQLYFVNLRDNN